MSILTADARKKLKTSDFAIPESRSYPIHDANHARDALARVSQYGTPEEKAKVRAAVHRKYPGMGKDDESKEDPKEEATETKKQEAAEDGQGPIRKMYK